MAKVLIVDDSIYFRLKLKSILEKLGHEVVGEAEDGSKASIAYGVCNPDVVTMDISMPNADGIVGVELIMEKDKNAKIIMVSAMGQKPLVLKAMRLGAKHFIVKPLSDNIVEKVLNKVL